MKTQKRKSKVVLRKVVVALTYVLAAAAIGIVTVILVAIGKGYSYDFKTGRAILNGLIIFGSTPAGASIQINGKDIHHKTPYRSTLESGAYNFEVTRDGYLPWTKRIEIRASEVSWAQYIFLIPTSFKIENVGPTNVLLLAGSKDHRRFAYLTGKDPGVWVLDSNSRNSQKVYTPKAATPDTPAETVSAITWSDDGSHLLLQTNQNGKNTYLLVPSAGGDVVSLTDLFKFDFNGLRFNPTNWRELYWTSPDGIRKLDVGGQTVSAVLADKVSSYIFAGDRILYIQATPTGKSLFSMDKAGRDQKLVIESLAESDSYELAYWTYRGVDQLAVLPAKTRTVTLYTDIYGSNPVSKVISRSADHITDNGDGRFLTFYTTDSAGTYDLEQLLLYHFNGNNPVGSLSWFDNYHLLLSRGGQMSLVEYDGNNPAPLTGVNPGVAPLVTSDQHFIIFVKPGQAGQLATVEMKK